MATYPIKFDVPHRGLKWLEYYGDHKVYHPGWDLNRGFGEQDLGDPIVSILGGEVEYVSPEPSTLNGQNGGLGRFVVVYHPAYGIWSRCAHMSTTAVKVGQKVEEGGLIGSLGKSGTKYAHCHFEVWKKAIYDIQVKHYRKFAYYPSGKTKAWVQDHYIDGLAFIDDLNKGNNWREQAEKWASKYINDVEGFVGEPDGHKIIELIRKVFESKK